MSAKHNIAEWSSSVARRAHNPKVVGSNPASATKYKIKLFNNTKICTFTKQISRLNSLTNVLKCCII